MFESWTPTDWFNLATAIVAASALIAAATPTPKDDEYVSKAKTWLKRIRGAIDAMGFNWGNARNDPNLKTKTK